MNAILSIVCIIFFAIITHLFIKGYNEKRDHREHCLTVLIPEDINLEVALNMVTNKSRGYLKKRAMELGASQSYVNNTIDSKLKIFIVQKSIEENNILSKEIEDRIKKMEANRMMDSMVITNVTDTSDVTLNPIETKISDPDVKIMEMKEDFDEDYEDE